MRQIYNNICALCINISERRKKLEKKEIRTNENLLLILLGGDTYMYKYKIFKKNNKKRNINHL